MNIENIKKQLVIVGVVVLILGVILISANPFVTIGPGERGILTNFGEVEEEVLGEGLHFILPVKQKVQKMDVKVQKSETPVRASSRDLQTVSSTVALNYHVVPEEASIIYQRVGLSFKMRVIDPAVQEVVKSISAQYTAEELITKRSEVSEAMQIKLSERLLKNHIQVDDFSIVDFNFSSGYQEEIEAKQVAEQRVKKAKLELDRIKIEKEQKIAKAEAEAEALKLQKKEITGELLRLREIEASMRAIEKWDGKLPNVTGEVIPFINMSADSAGGGRLMRRSKGMN